MCCSIVVGPSGSGPPELVLMLRTLSAITDDDEKECGIKSKGTKKKLKTPIKRRILSSPLTFKRSMRGGKMCGEDVRIRML